MRVKSLVLLPAFWLGFACLAPAASLDLTRAVVVVRSGDRSEAERTAATVLVEEVERRTGLRLRVAASADAALPAIHLTVPAALPTALPPVRAEGYQLLTSSAGQPAVWIAGADGRAMLYGVGAFLRRVDWARGRLSLEGPLSISSSPASPIRGH